MVGQGTRLDQEEAERLERLALAVSEQATPPWAAKYLEMVAPAVDSTSQLVEILGPAIYKFYASLYEIYRQMPTKVASLLWGTGICFFGGRYPLSLAAFEAFKLTGGSEVAAAWNTIKANAIAVQRANEAERLPEDAMEDRQALLRRKVHLVLRSIDPKQVSDALGSLWTGYLGLLAALRLKFARTTALAHSIGDAVRPAAAKLVGPSLLAVTPPEHHRWVSPCINISCKFLGLTVAWKLQKCLSTMQCGLTGGLLASRSALALLQERGVQMPAQDGLSEEVVGYSLAAAGIYYQWFCKGTAPIFLIPVMWPLGLLESWLQLSSNILGGNVNAPA